MKWILMLYTQNSFVFQVQGLISFFTSKMLSSKVVLLFSVTILLFGSLVNCDKESVQVVGVAQCVDCAQNNIENRLAFAGLGVAIICKGIDGRLEKKVVGEVNEFGKFVVRLPSSMVTTTSINSDNKLDGSHNIQLKQQCVAQLFGTTSPCRNGFKESSIIFKSTNNGNHIFSPISNLPFSTSSCKMRMLFPFFPVGIANTAKGVEESTEEAKVAKQLADAAHNGQDAADKGQNIADLAASSRTSSICKANIYIGGVWLLWWCISHCAMM